MSKKQAGIINLRVGWSRRFRGILRLFVAASITLLITVPIASVSAQVLEPPPPLCDDFNVLIVENDTLNGVVGFKVTGTGLRRWIPVNTGGTVGIQGHSSVITVTYGPFGASGDSGFSTIELFLDYNPGVDHNFDVSIHLAVNSVDVCEQIITPAL